MALTLLIMLATAHFENRHFVVTALGDNGGVDARAGYKRFADGDGIADPHHQNLIEHDLRAHVRRYLFYFKFFAGLDSVLLPAGFYDRVHG